ncbi:hypothetical protein HPP92_001729 [Vanilla planifolia]|uniref:Uncharacterized protein n=1 Tax=Vanilla planifolia TaxID=51239 RepID=A0A835RUI4_VANPL|nr:hypothetical protein HPP92_001729 [Vanilla planifolia]
MKYNFDVVHHLCLLNDCLERLSERQLGANVPLLSVRAMTISYFRAPAVPCGHSHFHAPLSLSYVSFD